MTASSPVTMEDLVNGLILTDTNGDDWRVVLKGGNYEISDSNESFNTVSISSDGLTITFGSWSSHGPIFASFTFNA